MELLRAIDPGIYRHFKGNKYEVIGIARHSETEEELVVYRALYGDFGLWIRPLKMFCEKVDTERYPHADQEYRFERIADSEQLPSLNETGEKGPWRFSVEDGYEREDLIEAKRQIDSVIRKLDASLDTFLSKDDSSRYKSQITLVRRRLGAFEIARLLIEDELH